MMAYCTYLKKQDIWVAMQLAAVYFVVFCFTVELT